MSFSMSKAKLALCYVICTNGTGVSADIRVRKASFKRLLNFFTHVLLNATKLQLKCPVRVDLPNNLQKHNDNNQEQLNAD